MDRGIRVLAVVLLILGALFPGKVRGQGSVDSLTLRFPSLWAGTTPGNTGVSYPTLSLRNPHEAFFCRQERKWELATGLPMKFRLGSWEQAQWLEGKANTTPSAH